MCQGAREGSFLFQRYVASAAQAAQDGTGPKTLARDRHFDCHCEDLKALSQLSQAFFYKKEIELSKQQIQNPQHKK